MARSTRQSARIAASVSSTTTPTTEMSPIFSTRPSVQTTPETSDDELPKPTKPAAKRGNAAVNKGKKRALPEDESDAPEEPPAKRRSARQSVSQKAYVEVAVRKTVRGPSKVSASHMPRHWGLIRGVEKPGAYCASLCGGRRRP